MYDRRHILWMSIIKEYDGCPSCMTYGCQSYMYDGCPSYLMFYSHKFPSYGTSKLNKMTIFDHKWNFWNLVAKFDK